MDFYHFREFCSDSNDRPEHPKKTDREGRRKAIAFGIAHIQSPICILGSKTEQIRQSKGDLRV